MPPYKRQHYLPAAYLKYFSVDQIKTDRDSWVWRFDGEEQCRVAIVSQCAANWYYSKEKAAEVEETFQRLESAYCKCVDRIRAGGQLTEKEAGRLLSGMFDFYVRNRIHLNETGQERIDAYRKQYQILWQRMVLNRNEGIVTDDEVRQHLYKYWRLRILKSIPGHILLTSDNPSVWTSVRDFHAGVHFLTLPLDPTHTAIAYDIRLMDIVSDQITPDDAATLNSGEIENSFQSVYCSAPFRDDQIAILREKFKGRSDPECKINELTWTTRILEIPLEHHFAFMRLTPPLM